MTQPYTYKDAGVDIDAGAEAIHRIKKIVAGTFDSRVLSEVGHFGGLFDVSGLPEKEPVLVSSIDSVGTKTKVAVACGRFDTIGHDIVNHCTNDILVQGARPLFFLDYIAVGHLDPEHVEEIVTGVARACKSNGCALIGGELCEMPDVYREGDLDLVGCIVGVVDRSRILNGGRVSEGSVLLGLASSGLHTNGYTLARKSLYEKSPEKLNAVVEGLDRPLGEVLLEPHRSYLNVLRPLLEEDRILALAHITGGGLPDNVERILPKDLCARIHHGSWPVPPIFRLLEKTTKAPVEELFRTFNMGIGMVAVVAPEDADAVQAKVTEEGCEAWKIGEITTRREDGSPVELLL